MNDYQVKIMPVAQSDINEVVEWYNDRKKGLGKIFYLELKARIEYVRKNPFHYQIQYKNIRNAIINRFPYFVHYHVDDEKKLIIIFGVTHMSRDPSIWKNRT